MQQALVDTSVLIAGTFEKDDNHEKGLELLRAFDRGKLPRGVVPTPMLKELLDFTLERKSPGDAEDVLDRLQESGGFEIVYPARSDFERGKLLFRKHAELGLADAMLVGLAERTETRYVYSFDNDFDDLSGVARLNSAVNPYDSSE